jgi:phage shock protein A
MGILKRAIEVTEAKINKFLNRVEDPNEMLDLSYEKMLSGLQEVRSHIADVVTEQKRLELQIHKCQATITKREAEAKAALQLGKEDLAQQALEIKQDELQQQEQYQQAYDRICAQVAKLNATEKNFKHRIEQFRQQKEISKASYQAAKAQVQVKESLTGISDRLGDVGNAITRAQDKAEQMVARADALDSMTESGVLDDTFGNKDSVSDQLAAAQKQAAAKAELEKLKQAHTDK